VRFDFAIAAPILKAPKTPLEIEIQHSTRIIAALAAALALWVFYPVDGHRYHITEIHQPNLTH
jgi:hypothetical protein